ncbi:hypothetical protein Q5424_23715 [Conexibacter sp. JD483]|uniref:hypothetical protein n=2 Tax=Conexibacter TaxID=191494 RepID=UPI0027285615|nr:hypothetical protein [Conexibacter sp. JD483]MDO8189252.1 hypothetical protein [Conexibacter sp. CPCC 205706]MDR9372125.1 hypothetical protein [Conexibacter sp. JD483]
MTEADVLAQLRTQEYAKAITRYVQRGGGKDGRKRLERFGKEFQKRWLARTECRSGFVVRSLCGNASGRTTTSLRSWG